MDKLVTPGLGTLIPDFRCPPMYFTIRRRFPATRCYSGLCLSMFVTGLLSVFTAGCSSSPTAPSSEIASVAAGPDSGSDSTGADRRGAAISGSVNASRMGWASQTGFRNADSPIRLRLVARLAAYLPGACSGRSMMTVPSGSRAKTWETDVEPGQKTLTQAVTLYSRWLSGINKSQTQMQVRTSMVSALSSEWGVEASTIADRVIARFPLPPLSISFVPTAPQDLLDLLGARAMCREFLDKEVLLAGGTPHVYADTSAFLSNSDLWRPGMGLYDLQKRHAAGIVDIYWDASGKATTLKLVEANWGNGYSRQYSEGQRPWERSVNVNRQVSAGMLVGSRYVVVNFDR
jgi:hypothetical protein